MLKSIHQIFVALLGLAYLSTQATVHAAEKQHSGLIVNAIIYDGTGTDAFKGNVRFHDGKITAIGDLSPQDGETVWNAGGLALAPGFIDPHSHHDWGLSENPAPQSVLAQGVTTIVVGADGFSSLPLANAFAELEQNPAAVNIASFGGHNTYRENVMGDDFKRDATADEIKRMQNLLQADLDAGALGISTGLGYEPSLYSARDEVIALSQTAADAGGKYTSHMRSEGDKLTEAIDELLDIARTTGIPANISHIKIALYAGWGTSADIIAKLNKARSAGLDITADIYPYQGWHSTMQILLPERDYTDRAAFEYALTNIASPESIIISSYDPNPTYIGKTLAEIATERNEDPIDVMMELVVGDDGRGASIIGRNMGADDIKTFMQWPHTSITSDGGIDSRHPRGQGAFPRVFAKYVRELGVLAIPQAIHKMTGLTAQILGIEGRGLIMPGYAADLVLFDPNTIQDNATFQDPIVYSTGIENMWVNGGLVVDNGMPTGAATGQVIRRPQ